MTSIQAHSPYMYPGAASGYPSMAQGFPPGVLPSSQFTGGFPAQQQQSGGRGFLGKAFGAVKSLAQGATVDLAKGLLTPKGLLIAGGAIALTVATGGGALPFLIAGGLALGGKAVLENGTAAYQSYQAGDIEGGEQALRGVGTGLAGMGLAAVGARAHVRSQVQAGNGARYGIAEGTAPNQVSTVQAITGSYRSAANTTRAAAGDVYTMGRYVAGRPVTGLPAPVPGTTLTSRAGEAASLLRENGGASLSAGRANLNAFYTSHIRTPNTATSVPVAPAQGGFLNTVRGRFEGTANQVGNAGRAFEAQNPGGLATAASIGSQQGPNPFQQYINTHYGYYQ